MNRREVLMGTAGAAATLLAANGAFAADKKDDHDGHHDHAMLECAKECQGCETECLMCSSHCLDEAVKGDKGHATCMQHCLDCAAMCQTCATVMSRGGPYAHTVAKVCADICDLCAAQCEKFKDDKHCTQCAKVCRDCAKECRKMVAA